MIEEVAVRRFVSGSETKERYYAEVGSDEVTIDANLVARLFAFLQCFGEHEFAHPVDAFVTCRDTEVVVFACREQVLAGIGGCNQGECEGRFVDRSHVIFAAKKGALECSRELGGGGE